MEGIEWGEIVWMKSFDFLSFFSFPPFGGGTRRDEVYRYICQMHEEWKGKKKVRLFYFFFFPCLYTLRSVTLKQLEAIQRAPSRNRNTRIKTLKMLHAACLLFSKNYRYLHASFGTLKETGIRKFPLQYDS